MQFQSTRATKMICKVIAGKAPNKRLHADVQTYAAFVVSLRYTLTQKLLRLGHR